jgi:hypothetical protein
MNKSTEERFKGKFACKQKNCCEGRKLADHFLVDDFLIFIEKEKQLVVDEVREKVKGMKRKKGSDDYVLRDQDSWYNQALNDILGATR